MLIDNLETFDVFSSAVAANDSAKIIRVFPGIANQDYEFNGRPVPKSYIQNDLYVTITTNDSLVFKMSNGKIEDSYGVISSKHAEDAVKALDGTPYSRDRYFDIEYVNVLSKQADSLQKEKERKAKAAKYKAQGLALISSHFANDGNGAKGIGFSVLNTSNKTAKYVIIEVVGYNSVDDPVWSDGYIMRCRGIGPVYPGDWGEWEFDNIWERGSIVRSYEIKTIIMQYTDGTSKSIKLPQPLPLNWKDWLY